MALWQYSFYILPREGEEELAPNLKLTKGHDGFDDEPFWRRLQVGADFLKDVDLILPKGESWSCDITLFGNQESNCIEILYEKSCVVSVSFRIDYRSQYDNILKDLVELCICKGLIIVDEEVALVPLNFLTIKSIIESSPQHTRYKELTNNE